MEEVLPRVKEPGLTSPFEIDPQTGKALTGATATEQPAGTAWGDDQDSQRRSTARRRCCCSGQERKRGMTSFANRSQVGSSLSGG
jgi:hypothetical protein